MIYSYSYTSYLPFGYLVKEDILTNLEELKYLIIELNKYNYDFISFNEQGIIIEYRILDSSDLSVTDLNILLEKFEEFKKQVVIKIENISNIVPKIVHKESSEFYLLFDLLPEKIKKEIKIYIK